jgi:hypothetical protein
MIDTSDPAAVAMGGGSTASEQAADREGSTDVGTAITACAVEHRSGCLLVWREDVPEAGELFFADGSLVAATFGGARGLAALAELLRTLPAATVRFFKGAVPERRNLDIAPQSVKPRLAAFCTASPRGAAAPEQGGRFVPGREWQEVPGGTAVPPGGEYRLELGGKTFARWPTGAPGPEGQDGPGAPPAPSAATPPRRWGPVRTALQRLHRPIDPIDPDPEAVDPTGEATSQPTATGLPHPTATPQAARAVSTEPGAPTPVTGAATTGGLAAPDNGGTPGGNAPAPGSGQEKSGGAVTGKADDGKKEGSKGDADAGATSAQDHGNGSKGIVRVTGWHADKAMP